MNVAELKRVVLTEPFPVAKERQDLAQEAKGSLGYRKLAITIGDKSLANALKKLDIAPLSFSSVEAYKRSKVKIGMWSGHREGINCAASIPVILGAIAWINMFIPAHSVTYFEGILMAVSVALAVLSLILLVRALFCFFDKDERGHRKVTIWKYTPLRGYSGTVPEYVLAKALEIKKELPSVCFAIDQLYEEEERTLIKRSPDPFLLAYIEVDMDKQYSDPMERISLAPEKYYIDVWDEKEYEDKM